MEKGIRPGGSDAIDQLREDVVMSSIRLRAMQETDLDLLTAHESLESDPWNTFDILPSNRFHRRFAENGGIEQDSGMLVVEKVDGLNTTLIGSVSWHPVQHGPTAACRALNFGISLFPAHRGQGYGTAAQRQLAEYLFATRLIERLEATTDVDNVAEQRALERAGFTREGVLRHAQFRWGEWRDAVLYSRLRHDTTA
jgi:RimJ/RimL family protein N-acetyltransferase